MQMCFPVRTPRWVSSRKALEDKLCEVQRCPSLRHAQELHARALRADLHRDPFVVPKLVAALSRCGHVSVAAKVFEQSPHPNAHLYNTMIRAHALNSQPSQAFDLFFSMQLSHGASPDNFTYSFLLQACYGKSLLPVIRMLHGHVEKCGFCADIFVPNSLIDSYCKSGAAGVCAAKKVFAAMGARRDVVSWNTMIGGLVKFGEVGAAQQLFEEMSERDLCTWNTMLDGYSRAGKLDEAFQFFQRMPERNVVSWSTIVSGYCKIGEIDMARVLFDKMPVKNLITWTIIVSGYAKKGLASEATELYDQMEDAAFKPDNGTAISILTACAESGLLGLGEKLHRSIKKNKLECCTQVSNALIDMYAKCGSLDKAHRVFDAMTNKDTVSWNAMLHGLATHGRAEEALKLFSRMDKEGFVPDAVTFVGVLCACTHAGLVKEGLFHFRSMEKDHKVAPGVEHYGCLVDLLGRDGRVDEAFGVVIGMPVEPNAVIWGTLLGACRAHNRAELAREVLDRLVGQGPADPGSFSALANIYAAAGEWDRVASTRTRMRASGARKPPGASSVEVDGGVHEFTAFDESHPQSDRIYQMIGELSSDLKRIGYVPIVH